MRRTSLRSAHAEASRLPPPHKRPQPGRDALTLLVEGNADLLAHAFGFLPAKALGLLERVSRTLQTAIRSPTMCEVWRALPMPRVLRQNALPPATEPRERFVACQMATMRLINVSDHVAMARHYKIKGRRGRHASAGIDTHASIEALPLPLRRWYADFTALLEAGADLDTRDREEQTTLHWAVTCGDLAMVKRLVEAGLDPLARSRKQGPNLEGAFPLGLALEGSEIELFLVRHQRGAAGALDVSG